MSTPAIALETQDALSECNFLRLAAFIHSYSGIRMPPSKRTMLEGRLRRRMRSAGITDVNDYCRYLFDDSTVDDEIIHFIDAVTTNKTEFFREAGHFTFMQSEVLPQIAGNERREIKAWSAACSIGAEPYSMAMVLDDFCQAQRGLSYSMLATDICTEVLGRALSGKYPEAMIEPVPTELRQRHVLVAKDAQNGTVRMAPHLRSRITFARLNLMDEAYAVASDFDVIFCRNVLIYFDKRTQAAVLERFANHLRPGGYLFLGHSESISGLNLPYMQVANTIFRRR